MGDAQFCLPRDIRACAIMRNIGAIKTTYHTIYRNYFTAAA
jgi:hypothetical protein